MPYAAIDGNGDPIVMASEGDPLSPEGTSRGVAVNVVQQPNTFNAATGTVVTGTSAQVLPALNTSGGILVVLNLSEDSNLYLADAGFASTNLIGSTDAFVLQPGREEPIPIENASAICVGADADGTPFSIYGTFRS